MDIATIFLFAVVVGAIFAIGNWRIGICLWFVAAILQDPIRKVTPDTPPYLTVAFLPIYGATFLGLCGETPAIRNFRRAYPQLEAPVVLFVVCLLLSFAQAVSNGVSYVPAALVGLFSYAGGLPAVMIGYHFLRRDAKELDPLIFTFIVCTSLMLIGVPLEQSGVRFSEPWLGTIGMVKEWRRWYSSTEWVVMISGFYRSPEIMGWHAMTMIVLCLHLMVRRPAFAWLCVPAATWGAYGVLMSGRRKMYLMVLVFAGAYLLTSGRWRRSQFFSCLLAVCLVAVPVLAFAVDDGYIKTAESGLAVAGKKATEKGVAGIMWLVQLVGWFGYGVGTKSQGAQHVETIAGTPLVEGGMEKVLVELGILGFAGAIFVLLTLARLCYANLQWAKKRRLDMAAPAAFFSIILANMSAFLVAFQFFGDPFVITFIGFFLGMLFSTVRMGHRRVPARDPVFAKPPSPEEATLTLPPAPIT